MKTIHIVNGDDWQGLYIDRKLVIENYELDLVDVLNVFSSALKISIDFIEPDEQWLAENGRLPEDLEDVKLG